MTTPQQPPALDSLIEIYEVWAGSDGIPEPQTACEAYLLRLIEQMRDIARDALKAALAEPVHPASAGFLKQEKRNEHHHN